MLESVDRIWHAFILNTALYAAVCEKHIGFPVHHDPLDPYREEEAKAVYAKQTLVALHETYGTMLHPEFMRFAERVTCCVQKRCNALKFAA
jgi:hypothetical protein